MSRETRQLLTTVLLAVVALWVLGRVRYPDRPPTPNPVPALLTQLTARPPLGELAAESTQLRARLGASLLAVQSGRSAVAAFRIRDDTALALIAPDDSERSDPPASAQHPDLPGVPGTGAATPIAADAATGLTLLRVEAAAAPLAPAPWTPRQLEEPRYLMASVASPGVVALRPAFVPSLQPVASPAWSGPIWAVPSASDLQPGSLVFTEEAQFAGLVVRHEDGVAIAPGAMVLADANRLRELPPRPAGFVGIEVQPLTPALAAATGARRGVVVAWIDPAGPAAGQLLPGDVIEAADGRWLPTRAHWDVREARLGAGDRLVLGVRRHGEWRDVQLVATGVSGRALPLGLTLRRLAGVGSEILRVDRPSAAAAAGIEPGDVITLIGTVTAPSPAQIRTAFESAAEGPPVLIALTRGTTSRVATLHP